MEAETATVVMYAPFLLCPLISCLILHVWKWSIYVLHFAFVFGSKMCRRQRPSMSKFFVIVQLCKFLQNWEIIHFSFHFFFFFNETHHEVKCNAQTLHAFHIDGLDLFIESLCGIWLLGLAQYCLGLPMKIHVYAYALNILHEGVVHSINPYSNNCKKKKKHGMNNSGQKWINRNHITRNRTKIYYSMKSHENENIKFI